MIVMSGLSLYLCEDEIGVRLDALRAAVATHLARRDLTGDLDAPGPAHRGRRADIEPGRGLSARHPAPDRLHRLLANIHRQRHAPSLQLAPLDRAPLQIWESALHALLNRHARTML
jgi:hypothetical protein